MLFQRAYTFYIEVLSQRASVKHLYWAGADSSNLSGRQLGVQREISHNPGGQTVVKQRFIIIIIYLRCIY